MCTYLDCCPVYAHNFVEIACTHYLCNKTHKISQAACFHYLCDTPSNLANVAAFPCIAARSLRHLSLCIHKICMRVYFSSTCMGAFQLVTPHTRKKWRLVCTQEGVRTQHWLWKHRFNSHCIQELSLVNVSGDSNMQWSICISFNHRTLHDNRSSSA